MDTVDIVISAGLIAVDVLALLVLRRVGMSWRDLIAKIFKAICKK